MTHGQPTGPQSGRWQHPLEDGRVQCDLCPRFCRLGEGRRGFCYVRQNQGGRIVLSAYGRSSGFCVDPIEKKPLNHFYPGTPVLSFGTAGCNMGCRFCQNWDISKARQAETMASRATPEAITQAAKEAGCASVAFTYNDPVIFAEYALDTAAACRALGIRTVAVTAGYIAEAARADFFAGMDAANVDLKAFTEDFYKTLCFAQLAPVLDTLEYIKRETETWLEITTLLIPGQNDSDAELNRLSAWIVEKLGPDVPLHFTAFHPDYKMLDLPPTPPETLTRARATARAAGLHYVYTGNVHDPGGGATYCPGCGRAIIERDWHQLGAYHIKDNACEFCATPIAGRFPASPGAWGPRRMRLNI